MQGLFICDNLQNIILKRKKICGQVHSVFKNACNIQCEDLFITLLSSNKKMAPMSLTVEDIKQVDFNSLNVSQGMKFEFTEKNIYCKEVNLFITMNNIKKWSSLPKINDSKYPDYQFLENIKIIGQGLKTSSKLYGMGPLINMIASEFPELELVHFTECDFDKNFQFIGERFLNFINAVIKVDIDGIGYMAQRVIGFGCGLTPAVDDFISAIMMTYIYMGNYYKLNLHQIYKFNSEIIGYGLQNTTRVSAEMLKHSSLGEMNEGVQDLLAVILNFYDDNEVKNHESINKSLLELIEYGDTSGTDTALGIYLGLSILANLEYRRVWTNE